MPAACENQGLLLLLGPRIVIGIALTAMEHATPTSAMQPPSAAEMVAPRLNSMPTARDLARYQERGGAGLHVTMTKHTRCC
jgi:hypothetical protein